ncbi:hypothetical protein HZB69_00260 [Candidatus Amesbacteria bacterium]|nr:hypothetical protein [Candidatus Amesbacteria bacterium]
MKKFKPGAAFSDFVILGSSSKTPVKSHNQTEIIIGDWLWVAILASMGILLIRLVSLQLFEGSKYRVLADENRISTIILPAPRGKILDFENKILEDNPVNSAVVGYVGEISDTEVGLLKTDDKYVLKDKIGRSGLQLQYEQILKGINGGRLVEVDNAVQVVRDLGRREPIPGKDIMTSINSKLQKTAYDSMAKKIGAVVISNPKTGEIMGLVSSPGYDPTKINQSLNDPNLPFFNRAIAGLYPPGSTFKMVTTTAALGSGKLNKNYSVEDTGVITVAGFKYDNWFFSQYGRTEGQVNWVKALTRSNDIFFYKVGETIGPDILASWAKVFGYGLLTGIDLPGEVEGLIPTPDWKEKFKGEKWFLGNTYHMAIGQGDVLTTPLQVNLMTNILATNKKCKLHIVNDPMIKCSNVEIAPDILDIIKKGMVGACKEGGTAYPFFSWTGPEVACKTGTAEYITRSGKYATHAWFTVFAPVMDPQISVTILIEGGGEGSKTAAPIARKILSEYFGIEDKFNYEIQAGEGE